MALTMDHVQGVVRGRVSRRTMPDGDRSEFPLSDGDVVAIGRGAECGIRFGHAPVQDREVPRHCGWLVVANGRILVHAADRPAPSSDAAHVRRPLIVTPDRGSPRALADGEVWGPDAEIFTVSITGAHVWELDVVNFRDRAPEPGLPGDLPTVTQRVDLPDDLWTVLRAYALPVQRGERYPATHEQVARTVHWTKTTVRRRLERIYDEFYLRRMELPDVLDMRIQVVEAAMSHGLIPRDLGGNGDAASS